MSETGRFRPARWRPALPPWRFVLSFGLVSLLADMVYEGARSIIGPYLATLGASAAVVGVTAGAGEFIGYGLRVVSGHLVSRTGHYWSWTITGYAMTVLSVPLIGASHLLAPALVLYGTERLGKAVRSPAKDTLLSHASTSIGGGTAFGVHQAMDQTGAVAGPLLLAAVLAATAGNYRVAFGALLIPGLLVLLVLVWLRWRVPDPGSYEADPSIPRTSTAATDSAAQGPGSTGRSAAGPAPADSTDSQARSLPALFWWYVAVVGLLSCGVASFPLLAFHAQTRGLVSTAAIPVLFAVAMMVDGASGLLTGRLYDRRGPSVLLAVPVAAGVAAISFLDAPGWVWAGVAVWGLVTGILDSTVKAVVTQLVPRGTRATAFGWLALVRGLGLLLAGAVLGLVYQASVPAVITLILVVNAAALLGLWIVLRRVP